MAEDKGFTKDWRPLHEANVFHVCNIDGLQLKQLWETSKKYCSDDDFSGEIGVRISEKSEEFETYDTILYYASTQGVMVTYVPDEDATLHIELPWLGSIGDVKLAFAYLNALKELCPECEIYLDKDDENEFLLDEDNFNAMVVLRLQNMMDIIENSADGQHMQVSGINHKFMVPSHYDYPDATIEDITFKAFNMFIGAQWNYQDYTNAYEGEVTSNATGEKFTTCFLTNDGDYFVGISQQLTILDGKGNLKNVPVDEFLSKMGNSPLLEMVDANQFVLRRMPDKEWQALFASLDAPVESAEGLHLPKIFLMRWNSSISSFTLENYKNATTEYPDGFQMNWNIYDWQEASKGDRYYMMRVDGDNPGTCRMCWTN